MKQPNESSYLPWVLTALPVMWIGAGIASGYEEGMNLFDILAVFSEWADHPIYMRWTPYTVKAMGIALAVYAFAVVIYFSTRMNGRPGEEHGSAHWGSVRALNRKYRDRDKEKNVILTMHLRMSLNGRLHLRNHLLHLRQPEVIPLTVR